MPSGPSSPSPFGLIAAVPASVALMAALLLVIFVLGRTGLGGLVTPDSALAPYIWFGAGVGAALGLARAASRRIPRTAPRVRLGLTGPHWWWRSSPGSPGLRCC